ncbi:MAG: protein kinase [Vicinamibacterales bacterium]
MALTSGTRIGVYEITAKIGEGGMGEVYRAHDTRLGRDVALKVLPDALASDPERVARFEREARTLAALNHPHIAQIHGFEHEGPVRALVMELVEGPTLADLLVRRVGPAGPAGLPLEDALAIATQIAGALEAAHEQGIVHRDLKPANIKVRDDGTVKVLDFGLAKAMDPHAGSKDPAYVPLSQSPTITSPALLTGAGMILGTAAYMSPEQAKGRPADARSDIWAFGVVLFEMLSGRRAFEGEDVADTIAHVLTKEPAWEALPPATPAALRRLLRKCLERNPAGRLRHIADVRFDLAEAATEPTTSPGSPMHQADIVARGFTARHAVLAGGLAVLAAVVSVAATLYLRPAAEPPPEVQFDIPATGTSPFISMSPDGRMIAYTSQDGVGPQLWVRSLDAREARVLPGTEGANIPDWSPDSREILFNADQKLKKINVAGGPPQTLTSLLPGNYQRATWSRDGVIVYSNAGRLFRVSADGGDAVQIAAPDGAQEEIFYATPWFLPDGRRFFYTAWSANPDNRVIYVASLDSNERTRLMPAQGKVQYVASGHVVFIRDGTLMAQPFDPASLAFRGDAVPLVDQVRYIASSGQAWFHVSDEGSLTYRRPSAVGDAGAARELVWFDRAGRKGDPLGPAVNTLNVSLSPDGSRVVSHEGTDVGPADVWVYEIERSVRSRLTTEALFEGWGVWSPDGTALAFAAVRGGSLGLFKKTSDGAGAEQRLLAGEPASVLTPRDWSGTAGAILFDRATGGGASLSGQRDLWVLPTTSDGKASAYLASAFDEGQGIFSPNGRFVAYTSNESGAYEVFVRPYPDASSGRWQISTGGGRMPRWRRDGKELYFLDGDSRLNAVSVVTDSEFRVGTTTSLFSAPLVQLGVPQNRPYDVSADGQRFLLSVPLATQTPADAPNIDPITVVLNWTNRLGRR